MKSSDKRWNIGTVTRTLAVLVLAFITVGLSISPVLADRDRRGDRGRYERGWQHERHGHYYWHGAYYDYPPPGYYYAPPPAPVYEPPPPPPSINFVFPLRIR